MRLEMSSKSSFIKAKNKEKEAGYALSQSISTEMCNILIDLFKCICKLWEKTHMIKGTN